MNKTITCIVGTRPEVIKMAPVIRALRTAPDLVVEVLCSGQHRDLLAPLMAWFDISVDRDLKVMSDNQSLGELTARLMQAFEQYFSTVRPDLVLAQGDTTTVMCAALSCFYRRIPFAHVEAGLRTFDPDNPFPEEYNRVAVTRLAKLHFCPTERALGNVLAEHVAPANAYLTGNTVIDALQFTTAKLQREPVRRFDHDILLTAHRRENFGEPLVNICNAVLDLCRDFPKLKVLYPVHPNPNVRATVEKMLAGHAQVVLCEPLVYPELVAAMQKACLILTDSGGIQEEAPALSKPVLVLRAVTERPEAVELGVAKVVGTERGQIVAAASELLLDSAAYARMARGGYPYGDGRAAMRISDVVCAYPGTHPSMKILRPLLKFAISLVLIAIVLRAFDVRGVVSQFAKVDAMTMVLVVAIALSIAVLHTVRWLAVIKANGTRLRFNTALQVVLIGHFFNQALPSSVGGDAVRIWCAYRAGLSFGAAANTVLIDHALTLLSLLLLIAAGLPWLFDLVTDPAARWALSTVLFAGVAGFGIFLALNRMAQGFGRWRVVRALLALSALAAKVMASARYALPVILLSVLSFVGFAVIVYSLARAMQLDVTLRDCILLVPPVILVTVVPISIAGWGVREGAMVVAFGFINVPASAAFAVSVMFGVTIAVASLPGSLFWWLSGYSIRNVAASTDALESEQPPAG